VCAVVVAVEGAFARAILKTLDLSKAIQTDVFTCATRLYDCKLLEKLRHSYLYSRIK
jgi:hypothetical protein